MRDSSFALEQSEFADILASERLDNMDFKVDNVIPVSNGAGQTQLRDRLLPRTLVRSADLIVSLTKLKTQDWEGVTLSMKNLFGVMPEAHYGRPKNVLHQIKITQSIVDITATARTNLAIADGVIGMEGDGPIMGTSQHSGVLIMGRNVPTVDATASRIIGIDPARIDDLAYSAGWLGAISEAHTEQRGEGIAACVQTRNKLDEPSLKALIGSDHPQLSD